MDGGAPQESRGMKGHGVDLDGINHLKEVCAQLAVLLSLTHVSGVHTELSNKCRIPWDPRRTL